MDNREQADAIKALAALCATQPGHHTITRAFCACGRESGGPSGSPACEALGMLIADREDAILAATRALAALARVEAECVAAVAAEREACAKVALDESEAQFKIAAKAHPLDVESHAIIAARIADNIRKRGAT